MKYTEEDAIAEIILWFDVNQSKTSPNIISHINRYCNVSSITIPIFIF